MAIGQLTKDRKHEPNPYRPDLPEDLRGISPNLYDFLRETAETLREQHNLTQAGDSTFSWEVLTEVDLKPRYNVGSLGRFYHPNYGVIHARYCRISGFKSTEWLGAPVGLRVDGDPLKWSVTNDMSKSKPDLVVGLGGWFVLPPEDSCGWVIVNGVNIQSLAIRKRTDLTQFDKFVWGATDRAQDAKAAQGRVFGSVLGVSADVEEVTETDTGGDFFLATKADRTGTEEYQRFQPLFWTCNFPSTMIASLTTLGETLICDATFYRTNDLCGIIWESEDTWDHPLTSYDTNKDYSGCVLSFTINISGDTVNLADDNGPVLTIEGRDGASVPTIWYVRLINYRVSGDNVSAQIVMDFDDLFGGFAADVPVFPGDIDRMFIGFVPASYDLGPATELAEPEVARIELSNIHSTGTNATLVAGTGFKAHALRMTNGYDDTYNLTPERLVRNCHRLGYRKWFNHYVGMSHYFYWEWDAGESRFIAQDIESPLNASCQLWHTDLCRRLKALEYDVIFSISYEMLNSFIPANWRQLDSDGLPALTGWAPPSSLFSPCIEDGMEYLNRVFVEFADILNDTECPIHMQMGEPWWWIDFRDFKPYFYDATTVAKWEADTGLSTPIMTSMVGEKTDEEIQYLNWLGDRLAESTAAKIQAVRDKYPVMTSYVLIYLPQVLSGFAGTPDTPEAKRVNIPLGWAKPAFDVMQLEDYDFVINNEPHLSEAGRLLAEERLGYPREEQQYFSGFVLFKEDEQIWEYSSNAVRQAYEFGVPEVFIWAYTQVMRDGYVNLLDPDSLYRTWNVPPGFAFVDQQADSEKRIRDWIGEAVDGAVDQIVALQSQVNQLLGSGGIGGLTVRIGAAEKTIAEHTILITRQGALTAQNFLTLNDRVTNLEQRTSTGGGGSGAGTIRTDLNNLTNEFNEYRNTTNGRYDILRTQMDGVLSITSGLPGELESIRSEFNGIGDRITDLRLWNLADVPDDYVGQGNKFLQILADESGATYTALTAGIVGFTPTGSLSSTDVQAALAELDAEKVHRVASTDNVLARFDGTNGAIQNSGVILDDSNNISNVASLSVADDAYNGAWNGSTLVPTRNAVWDKIESLTFVTTFLQLTDTPANYTGAANKILQVNAGANQVVFSDLTAGIVAFTPTGTLAATTVQAALAELAAEKTQGPGASTDNAITRWDGTGGFQLQNSGVIIDDSNNITGAVSITVTDDAYGAGWNGSSAVPTKNAVYDKIESILASSLISDTGTYVAILDGTGSTTIQLGGTGDPGNYYDNTTHYFRSRGGGANFISFNASLFTSNVPIIVPGDAYASGWNGSTQVPTKDAVYDKIESLVTSIAAKLTGVALTNSAALIPSINSPWINYGGGFGGVRYYKSADGVVHIEGLIQAAGGSPTSGVVLFTLLAGYRPPDTLMFGPWSGGGACRIDVRSNGDVVMQSGNTAFTSLSGISFIPA